MGPARKGCKMRTYELYDAKTDGYIGYSRTFEAAQRRAKRYRYRTGRGVHMYSLLEGQHCDESRLVQWET
jgi:hypothetical protein